MLKYRAGFTLIELMIALALGLVITAAAIMLFITGQRSYSMQQGVADLQDNANFGLNYIVRDIRLANLNSTRADINDQVSFGGIVLTSAINAQKDASVPPLPLSNLSRTITGSTAAVSLLSRSSGTGMSAATAPAWLSRIAPLACRWRYRSSRRSTSGFAPCAGRRWPVASSAAW